MEYALAGAIGLGLLFVFGGVYTLMTSGGTIDERLARYAGPKGKEDEKKKSKDQRRPDVDMPVSTAMSTSGRRWCLDFFFSSSLPLGPAYRASRSSIEPPLVMSV